MTDNGGSGNLGQIIPYQELLGNYDGVFVLIVWIAIIPYQELLGNYDSTHDP